MSEQEEKPQEVTEEQTDAEKIYGTPDEEVKEEPAKEEPAKEETPAEPEKVEEPKEDSESKEVEYKLELSKDSLLSKDATEKTAIYAKEQGLSPEQAQAVLDKQNEAVQEFHDRQQEANSEMLKEWQKEVRSDKEIAGLDGRDFDRNQGLAQSVIKKFGSEDFKAALEESGLGDHPELVRFCIRAGKAMSEDTLSIDGAHTPKVEKSAAELIYGGTTPSQ